MTRESRKPARSLTLQHPAAMNFSMVPLLLASRDLSADARRALAENRLLDAAGLLMHEHGLSCVEAGDLLDVSAC
jgi:hypothetical protein